MSWTSARKLPQAVPRHGRGGDVKVGRLWCPALRCPPTQPQGGERPLSTSAPGPKVLTAVALATITACSGSSSPTITAAPSLAATSSAPSPTAESDESMVLAGYNAFWQGLAPASRLESDSRRLALSGIAADPELRSLIKGMEATRSAGNIFFGPPVLRPHLSALSRTKGTAVIQDCQDARNAGTRSATTGAVVTHGTARTAVVSTMHRQPDGRWLVVFVSFPKTGC